MFDFLGKMTKKQWIAFVNFINNENSLKNEHQTYYLNKRLDNLDKLRSRLVTTINDLNSNNLDTAVWMATGVASGTPEGLPSGSGDRIIDTNVGIPFDKMHEVVRPTIKELYERWEYLNKRCNYSIWRVEEQIRKREGFEDSIKTISDKISGYFDRPEYDYLIDDTNEEGD